MISNQSLLELKKKLGAEVIDDEEELSQELFLLVPDLIDEILALRAQLAQKETN